jgi:putative flavoprotein involved in K+ transport
MYGLEDKQAKRWLSKFGECLDTRNVERAVSMFAETGCWRDLLSFSWNIITVTGKEDIGKMFRATCTRINAWGWKIEGDVIRSGEELSCWFSFETEVALCKGKLTLIDGRCTVFFTSSMELKSYEERTFTRRKPGYINSVVKDRKTWLDCKEDEEGRLGYSEQPYVVVVGGGQGGIGLAARLRMLGVPTIVIDKNNKAGDSWRNRYHSLYLRNTVWQDHLPYLEFPDNWPIFMSKDKMGDWLEMYVKVMEINYWTSSDCTNATYRQDLDMWSIEIERRGETIKLSPKHLVIATGMSGYPKTPEITGAELFNGVICHSSSFMHGKDFAGRRAVVVGSNNSAHDICMDLWEQGCEVTMLQRSSTLVVRSETFLSRSKYTQEASDSGIKTADIDLSGAAIPYNIMRNEMTSIWAEIAEQDKDYYKRLRDKGFLLSFGEDLSGLEMMYMYRGSGYYIDVGATELIVQGKIGLRSSVTIESINHDGIVLSDGSELGADLIVFATGYESMDTWISKLISQEVATKVGRCWGLGSGTKYDPGPWEGELRNMWKPTPQEGLWLHGGGLTQSRLYSRYVAMQLKARMENIPTPVYG